MKPDELYDRYGEKMYHYLALKLGSPEDAEDVLQEAFCRLARYSLRWALVRNPRAFVFKVLRNEANRFLARRIKQRAGDQVVMGEAGRLASVIEGPAEAALAVRALGELPDEQREVIVLKVFQDFSFKEIAAICGLSINTAASRYRYGIEKLRSSLEGKT
ncbi:MAG TPA: sigma-70 family RNA polymerase sigma factor [Burkholderiales bacterium]|nr:sigma-70 family RNA polymerase sigma factor [Burkholderiales bacterium]